MCVSSSGTPGPTPTFGGCTLSCDSRPCVGRCADGTVANGSCTELTVDQGCACAPNCSTPTATATPTYPITGCVYVANLLSDTVSVIDAATKTVTKTIAVGQNPDGVAISHDDTFTYVANFLSNDVSVIENATNTVTASIPVGIGPVGIATISPNTPFVYVADKTERTIAVIDTDTNTVTAKIPLDGNPEGVAMAGFPTTLYATESFPQGSGNLLVIDTATNTIEAAVPVGLHPNRVAIGQRVSPLSGLFAYVTNFDSFDISVIDLTTNTLTGTIGLSLKPNGIAITPDSRFAYLTSDGSFSVSIIDTMTNAVIASVPVGTHPTAVAMGQGTPFTYVTNFDSDTVSVIARDKANAVVATIPVGHGPFALGVGRYELCAASTPTGTVSPVTASPTPTPPTLACVGDCNSNGQVTVDELLAMVNIALTNVDVSACEAGDANHDGTITIDEILTAVSNALIGCKSPTPQLRWYHGCGPPVVMQDACPSSVQFCSTTEQLGVSCNQAGATCCQAGSDCTDGQCNNPLLCSTKPPETCPV
ncbi:MAG: hypothetical protein ACHQ4J_03200 [Candidatus Binatia bacterium]